MNAQDPRRPSSSSAWQEGIGFLVMRHEVIGGEFGFVASDFFFPSPFLLFVWCCFAGELFTGGQQTAPPTLPTPDVFLFLGVSLIVLIKAVASPTSFLPNSCVSGYFFSVPFSPSFLPFAIHVVARLSYTFVFPSTLSVSVSLQLQTTLFLSRCPSLKR